MTGYSFPDFARSAAILVSGLLGASYATAQSTDYAELLARVQQGGAAVDFRAFRIAGALRAGSHRSMLETGERATFKKLMAAGDFTGALDAAKQALARNYASPLGHFDAMTAYQALGMQEEAAAHGKILSALLDSIGKSGDGKGPETAYFVVTTQEEYIFLSKILGRKAASQSWLRKDGHFYDRLELQDLNTNQIEYVWFNVDLDARDDPAALAAVTDGVLARATAAQSSDAPQTDSPARLKFSPLVLTKRVQPEYTPEARAAGLEGSVVLYIEVNPAGEVENTQVIQSLGLGLDEQAMDAVKQWRFKPRSMGGRPPNVAQSAEVNFRLDPSAGWQIRRAGYRVNRDGVHELKQISKPVLSEYTSPGNQACRSDGGVVIANFRIGKDGKPDQVRLVDTQNEAAGDGVINAIRLWRFRPGVLNGKPRESSGTVEMECRSQALAATSEGAEALIYKIGPGISAPAVLYKVEPEYSEEARRAKLQGTVIISVLIDTSGHAVSMRVVRELGLELDEKAMEAINQWRFKPGTKDGKPVIVRCTIEVNFRLL